jgi:hypothetical protein
MTLLEELKQILHKLQIPCETVKFSAPAPNTFARLDPIADALDAFADDAPWQEYQEVRISLYTRGNYRGLVRSLTRALLAAGITITERLYVEFEEDTGYHHYSLDAAQIYEFN